MDRRTFLAATAALTLGLPGRLGAAEAARIGLVLPLSGERAAEARLWRDAALAAIDHANRRRGRPIFAELMDSKGEGRAFLAALHRLADQKAVSVFGPCPAGEQAALGQFLDTRGGLFWDPGPVEPGGCHEMVIAGGPSPAQSLGALLPFMTAEIGRRVLVVGDASARRRGLVEVAAAMVETQAFMVGRPVLVEGEDFAPVLGRIRRERVDVVLSLLEGSRQIAFLGAYRAAGIDAEDVPVASPTLTEGMMAAAGDAAAGHVAVQPYFSTWDSPENAAFLAAFRKRAGEGAVPCPTAETLWWQIQLFAKALDRLGGGELHPVIVREAARGGEVAAPQGRVRLNGDTMRAALWPKIAVVEPGGKARVLAHTAKPVAAASCLT